MDIELVEGVVIQYTEVVLGFTSDDLRFAMGMAAADPEAEDIESLLIQLSTHHAFVDLLMDGLRESLRAKQ